MAPAEAFEELRELVASVEASEPDADSEAAAARLLERVSTRPDALELRAALVAFGAACAFDAIHALPER